VSEHWLIKVVVVAKRIHRSGMGPFIQRLKRLDRLVKAQIVFGVWKLMHELFPSWLHFGFDHDTMKWLALVAFNISFVLCCSTFFHPFGHDCGVCTLLCQFEIGEDLCKPLLMYCSSAFKLI